MQPQHKVSIPWHYISLCTHYTDSHNPVRLHLITTDIWQNCRKVGMMCCELRLEHWWSYGVCHVYTESVFFSYWRVIVILMVDMNVWSMLPFLILAIAYVMILYDLAMGWWYWYENETKNSENRIKRLYSRHFSTNWLRKKMKNMIQIQLISTSSTGQVGFIINITFLIFPEMIQFIFKNTNVVKHNNVIRQTISVSAVWLLHVLNYYLLTYLLTYLFQEDDAISGNDIHQAKMNVSFKWND